MSPTICSCRLTCPLEVQSPLVWPMHAVALSDKNRSCQEAPADLSVPHAACSLELLQDIPRTYKSILPQHHGDDEVLPCRGSLPVLSEKLRSLRIFSATNVSSANGRYPLNSVGDPLPEIFMFNSAAREPFPDVPGLMCPQISSSSHSSVKLLSVCFNSPCSRATIPCYAFLKEFVSRRCPWTPLSLILRCADNLFPVSQNMAPLHTGTRSGDQHALCGVAATDGINFS